MSVTGGAPTSAKLLLAALKRHAGRTAITVGDRGWSYADLDLQSDRLAAFLSKQGVGPGVAVSIHLRNGWEYVVAEFAILKLAAVRVPLNELMGEDELDYCLRHSGARILINHADLPGAVNARDDLCVIVVGSDERLSLTPGQVGWDDALAGPGDVAVREAAPDDTALIAYTGGTTGRPKGVRHSYGGIAWNLFSHINCLDIRAEEVMLLTTPLPHSSGYHMAAGLLQGAHVVIEPGFSPDRFFTLCRDVGVTWTMMVPTMLYRLLDHHAAGSANHRRLNTIVYGAAPINRLRLEDALRKFGSVFIQIYGQTECPNLISTLEKDDHADPSLLASCGRAVPLVDIRLGAEEAGIGEVEVRSPYLLTEYFRNEDATSEALRDGWLRTGDLARIDKGYLFLVDRAKDMIISGGMNVYSSEVEAALRTNKAICDVAVIGIPHDDWGEAVTAVVVAIGKTSEEDIRQYAKSKLSAYKVPKNVYFVNQLPLTSYGKIDKKNIRAMLMSMGAPPAFRVGRRDVGSFDL